MELVIASANVSHHINLENNVDAKGNSSARFKVFPAENAYIEFATGEIFCNPDYEFTSPDYKKSKSQHRIECGLTLIERTPKNSDHKSVLKFHDGTDGDPFLMALIFLDAPDLNSVLRNIQRGNVPTSIEIGWPYDFWNNADNIISFGEAPDGSHHIWNSAEEENQAIGIETVSFHYTPLPLVIDEVTSRPRTHQGGSLPGMIQPEIRSLKEFSKKAIKGLFGTLIFFIVVWFFAYSDKSLFK